MSGAAALEFAAAEHRYRLGAQDLLSVTTILEETGLMDARWFTDESRQRGSYVHLACHLIDTHDLDEQAPLDPVLGPYVEAYRSFMALTQPAWEYLEHRVCDSVLGYAGTLDRAGTFRLNGHKTLIDIKTGAVPPWVGPQTAAYRRCLPQPHTWKRAALQLKDDGSFAIHALTDRADEAVFLAALTLTQWKRRNIR